MLIINTNHYDILSLLQNSERTQNPVDAFNHHWSLHSIMKEHLSVAIIGGGAAGIIAARCCTKEGLVPTVFEATSRIGGHWSNAPDAPTGVFDGLMTNIPFYEIAVTDVLPLRTGP